MGSGITRLRMHTTTRPLQHPGTTLLSNGQEVRAEGVRPITRSGKPMHGQHPTGETSTGRADLEPNPTPTHATSPRVRDSGMLGKGVAWRPDLQPVPVARRRYGRVVMFSPPVPAPGAARGQRRPLARHGPEHRPKHPRDHAANLWPRHHDLPIGRVEGSGSATVQRGTEQGAQQSAGNRHRGGLSVGIAQQVSGTRRVERAAYYARGVEPGKNRVVHVRSYRVGVGPRAAAGPGTERRRVSPSGSAEAATWLRCRGR